MKKFKLTKETKEAYGTKLFRIEALKDFSNAKKGDKGGFVEKEENLSQEGNAWVSGNAMVYSNARVYGDARVYGKLKLEGGYFYHYKEKTEKIEEVEVDDNHVILCSKPRIGKEETPSLKGKKVSVELDGVKYEAIIQ